MLYDEMINSRSESFDTAMSSSPFARRNEFLSALKYIDIKDGHVVVDFPSEGGHLKNFINADIVLKCVKTVEDFLPTGRDGVYQEKTQEECHETMPFAFESVDCFISIVGLHHIPNLMPFLTEAHRSLKIGGRILIGEVTTGSPVAYFLNHYVDKYSSAGHKGIFLDEGVCTQLLECGFSDAVVNEEKYMWEFTTVNEMVHFTKGLFSLDLASDSQIEQALADTLGFSQTEKGVSLNWQLSFFSANK